MNETELATFASGCFWCTEAIFQRLKGVLNVTSGYSGGDMDNPSYSKVSSGSTGHAEAVQIEFDPSIISYETLLDIFWHTHNPTTLNQQGADVGTQYRSVIFYHNKKQKKLAEESRKKLEDEKVYQDAIVTEIVSFEKFYKAEDYHQNYYNSNPGQPYCSLVIDPKVQKLLEKYHDLIKEEYRK